MRSYWIGQQWIEERESFPSEEKGKFPRSPVYFVSMRKASVGLHIYHISLEGDHLVYRPGLTYILCKCTVHLLLERIFNIHIKQKIIFIDIG